MHPLLKRQLRKLGLGSSTHGEGPPDASAWPAIIERISATYTQADQDRYMLERSLERSSEEMADLYDELRTSSAAALAKANDELVVSLALVTGVLESVADAIVVVDGARAIRNFNCRFIELFGITPDLEARMRDTGDETLLWAHCQSVFRDPEGVRSRIQKIYADADAVVTDEVELLDGRILSRYSAPVKRGDGVIRARMWCFRDVTEAHKLAIQRAIVSERMASVGQLVSSVAHEINNPLAYIAGNVELVASALREDGPLPIDQCEDLIEALEDARVGVDRIKVIVRDLRMMSRADDDVREPIDLHRVIDSTLHIASNDLRHRACVVRDLKPVPLVLANSVRLGQVLINLLLNAAQAIGEGRASENTVTVATFTSHGKACIQVSDTGGGIALEHVERIFDPFFTTKPVGVATGLGLSICKGIVEKIGGTIRVSTEVGAGSTFTVELPAAPTAIAPRTMDSAIVEKQAKRRRVLVVDDDAQIRRWFQRILPQHDITVLPSVDAAEQLLATAPAFDAILCDVMMPDRTGLDMHILLTEKYPHLLAHVVFMSGGAFTPALAAFVEEVPNVCLKKPFPKPTLERAIERAANGMATREEPSLSTAPLSAMLR